MMIDPLSDMLTRIRNAVLVRKPEVVMPCSKLKHAVAELLQKEGFVQGVQRLDNSGKPILQIQLKYRGRQPIIRSIRTVSTPGRRVYRRSNDIPYVLNGLGIAIVSTSKGLMTDHQARKEKLGGEILCEVH